MSLGPQGSPRTDATIAAAIQWGQSDLGFVAV